REKRVESDADFGEQQLAAFLSVDDADAVLDHGPVSAEPFDRAPERATGRDDVLDEEDSISAIELSFELFFRPVLLRGFAHHDEGLPARQANGGSNRDRTKLDTSNPIGLLSHGRNCVRDILENLGPRYCLLEVYVIWRSPARREQE